MSVSSIYQLSVVILVYNQEERILSQVVGAIESLDRDNGLSVECVIVDNSSKRPASKLPCVEGFLDRCPWAKAIRESRQGVTFARIAGIKATTAPVILFFDDDNEPSPDYLNVALRCLKDWPSVAMWGPGRISVEFLDPVSDSLEQRFRQTFNERNHQYPEYGCVHATWAHFYPAGMGLVIRREIAERYTEAVENGLLTLTARSGDIQLVWEAIKIGQAVGVHPDLQMKHLIPGRRSNLGYAKRLTYGIASRYAPALVESFPSALANRSNYIPSNAFILKRIHQITSKRLLQLRIRDLTIELANFLGHVVGGLRAARSQKRQWVFRVVELLKLE
jgi:glycosyltransferase involved in cell wall biosynthesis